MVCEHVRGFPRLSAWSAPILFVTFEPIQADDDVTMSWVSALLMGRTCRRLPRSQPVPHSCRF